MDLIRISESDNFIVDYDKSRGMYRVSVFDDIGHWQNEHWFDAYDAQPKNRVLTVDELNGCCLNEIDSPLWVEYPDNTGEYVYVADALTCVRLFKKDYNYTLRYWLRKPTDEERKAVAWDG